MSERVVESCSGVCSAVVVGTAIRTHVKITQYGSTGYIGMAKVM